MNTNNNKNYPDKADFKPPVGWLAGRELLAALKRISSYVFMGDKQDPKDWMYARPITPPNKNKGSKESYWFDYIADTGDGMKAVYTIAYLSMSDLWIGNAGVPGPEGVALTKDDDSFPQQLPRGEFLFIGGDTAYHIADTASLRERFQIPFNCAFDDLIQAGKKVERRPLYGIPANHDYYDALDGFNRQFLKPITPDNLKIEEDEAQPRLALKGFYRSQSASYVLLKLPFDWQIWGFDSQQGQMDIRQWAFFVSTFHEPLLKQDGIFEQNNYETLKLHVPSKLIVATPEPNTVFGKWTGNNADIVQTFTRLGLEPSFLETPNGRLDPGKCRLDISGDIHHYERYWGSVPADAEPANYASLVAGGGGAFLHPSHTDINEVTRKAQYPSRKDSHTHITTEILNPLNIAKGGYLWLVGAIVALLSYFAVTIPQSTWSLFELIPNEKRPGFLDGGLLSKIQADLDTSVLANSVLCCANSYYGDLIYILVVVAFLVYWVIRTPSHFKMGRNNQWRRRVVVFVLPVIAGFVPLLILINLNRPQIPSSFLAGFLIDLYFIAAVLHFGLSRRYSDILIIRAKSNLETVFDRIPLWILNVMGVVYAGFGFLHYGIYSTSVMSVDLLIALVWVLCSVGLVALAGYVGGALFIDKAKARFLELARFVAIGGWHGFLQLTVPVCLALYSSWMNILIISVAVLAINLLAGRLFTSDFLVKELSFNDQKKIGNLLLASWVIVGIGAILAASGGQPAQVTWMRLLSMPVLGAFFSCIWFGWYLSVSLAFNGHNNEAGGGARSERFRHMIRFKLTENTLTGYVIGVDRPITDFSTEPKFSLVDVFTIKIRT